LTRSLD